MTHILLSQNWLFPLKLRITWGRWSVFLHSNNLFCWQPCKPAIFTRQSIYKKVLCTVRHKRLTATTVYIRRPIHQNKTFTPKGFDRPSLKQSYGDESNTVEEREGKIKRCSQEDFLTFRPYKKDKLRLYPIDDPPSASHLQHTFGCIQKLPDSYPLLAAAVLQLPRELPSTAGCRDALPHGYTKFANVVFSNIIK